MANAPIGCPRPLQFPGTPFPGLQLSALGDSSNTFVAGQFLKVSSGALAPYVADDTAICGLASDASHAATDEPYSQPFGENHNPIALRGVTFLMNITDGSGTVGSGSTTQADVTIGTLYSARYLGTIDTSAAAIDASDTGTATKHIFRVVGKWSQDASTDYNGRVMVQVIDTAIQTTA
jgi:hypothetical protein